MSEPEPSCAEGEAGRYVGSKAVLYAADLSALRGVSVVEGHLTIGRADGDDRKSQVKSLADLSCLREVTGNLLITRNSYLEDLDGLSQLQRVGGSLEISKNDALRQVDGLDALSWVDKTITLSELPELSSIQGFDLVTHASGLRVVSNLQLEELGGFSLVSEFSGDLSISFSPKLRVVSCCQQLGAVDSLRLSYNDVLSDVSGLDSLQVVTSELSIADNGGFTSLDAFNGLLEVNHLSIWQNVGLHTVDGFSQLAHADYLGVRYNAELQDLLGFDVLADVGRLDVDGNPSLLNCAAEQFRQRLGVAAENSHLSGNKAGTCP